VIPEALPRAMTSSEPGVAQRAAEAMMKMRKIIVADIEAAVAG
jgi:predicted 3-demethylubiquinone-9 3-methyltransferase (glyoxalase superfamily)